MMAVPNTICHGFSLASDHDQCTYPITHQPKHNRPYMYNKVESNPITHRAKHNRPYMYNNVESKIPWAKQEIEVTSLIP